jgi:glutamate carboxypeptidase
MDGGKASGPGVIDMKGGDVILLLALQALSAAGELDGMSVTVIMTGDEERSGDPLQVARRSLIEAAGNADVAIGFEDGDGKSEHAVIARRGASSWTLRVTGTPAHSSQIFTAAVGPGAIFEAARILELFRAKMAGEEYLTFSPGVILGGTDVDLDESQSRGTAFGKSNVVAGHAVVQGDLRTVSPSQLEKAQAEMRAIVARSLPHTGSEITFDDSYPPMAPSEGNRRLLRLYDRVSRDLGFGPVTATDPRDAGAADVSFTAAKVEMAIDGLGLKGKGGHTVQETADLGMLAVQAKRAAVLLHRLAGAGDSR